MWYADSSIITADSSLFTADGGDTGTGSASTSADAGRSRRRHYLVKVGDTEFLTSSLAEAESVLQNARRFSAKAAQNAVQSAISAPEKAKVLARPPKIVAPADLARQVNETREFVKKVYAAAFADYELYLMLSERMRQEDDEDALLLM